MKRYHFGAVGLLCLLLSVGSFARAQNLNKPFSFGLGLEAGAPTGDATTAYHFTGGLTIRFSVHAGPGFVTLGTGAEVWSPKSFEGKSTKASLQIPVLVGYKYVFAKPFFVMGEIGYSSFRVYYDGGSGGVASTSYGGFTWSPTVGVNLNVIELGIKYEATSLSTGTFSAVKFRLGFNF
jgi:hypothetical protein